jgi:mRNA interferase YafQ
VTDRRDKRASLPRTADFTKTFAKDWERLSRSGRYDMRRLKVVMMQIIANDSPLGPEWKDHALAGNWAGYRECHAGGDFLLIYTLDEKAGAGGCVIFTRAGTHLELFE